MTKFMAMDNDGDFWPPDAFAGVDDEPEEVNNNQAEVPAPPPQGNDWQEAQSDKLKNILNRRRCSLDPGVLPDPDTIRTRERGIRSSGTTNRNMRKSKSAGERHHSSSNSPPPLQRTRSRESGGHSPPPSTTRRRSPKEGGALRGSDSRDRSKSKEKPVRERGSPRGDARKVRGPKKSLPRRCKSMDATKTFSLHNNHKPCLDATKNILDDDDNSWNGSMEFNVHEVSPVAATARRDRPERHLSHGNNNNNSSAPRLQFGGSMSNPRLGGSNPRLRGVSPAGPTTTMTMTRDEATNARRQKLMKRKNSLKAGSLRRLVDVETTSTGTANNNNKKGELGDDDISIDDTVQMDESDEKQQQPTSNSKSRRGPRSLLGDVGGGDEPSKSRRSQRTLDVEGDSNKSRRGQRSTAGAPSKRDLLRKTMSDKPDRAGTRRRRSLQEDTITKYQSKSFNSNSQVQRMKDLAEQHQQAKQQLGQDCDETELSLEELQSHSNKTKTKSGIESLANLSINRNNGSSKGQNSFNGSWAMNASGDNLSANSKEKPRKYKELAGNLVGGK